MDHYSSMQKECLTIRRKKFMCPHIYDLNYDITTIAVNKNPSLNYPDVINDFVKYSEFWGLGRNLK